MSEAKNLKNEDFSPFSIAEFYFFHIFLIFHKKNIKNVWIIK